MVLFTVANPLNSSTPSSKFALEVNRPLRKDTVVGRPLLHGKNNNKNGIELSHDLLPFFLPCIGLRLDQRIAEVVQFHLFLLRIENAHVFEVAHQLAD